MEKIDLTVGACIVFEGEVLLMHHTKLNKWLFPGGHIDPNETPDIAVVRETKEETGLDLKLVNYSGIKQSPEEIERLAIPFHTNLHNVGDHDHYCSYYLGTVSSPNFVKNKESKDIKWFSAGEIKKSKELLPVIKRISLYAIENINKT